MSITKNIGETPAIKRRKLSHSPVRKSLNERKYISATTTGSSKSFMMDQLTKELLSEVRPNYETQHSRIEETIEKVIQAAKNAPARPPLSAIEAEKSLHKSSGLAIPFPEPKPGKETQYQFDFQKPESVGLIGSTMSKLYLKGPSTVDVAVTMPPSMLQKKDYLNHRAFHKRAFYLACIAAAIKNATQDEFSLSYDYQDDMALLPVLLLSPTEKSPAGFMRSNRRVRVLVTFPESAIPLDKTLPTKNCVRPPGGVSTEDTLEATPFYNSCLRMTAFVHKYQSTISQASEKCPNFDDACRLGRVWLRQRDMGSSISKGGFGPCEWAI